MYPVTNCLHSRMRLMYWPQRSTCSMTVNICRQQQAAAACTLASPDLCSSDSLQQQQHNSVRPPPAVLMPQTVMMTRNGYAMTCSQMMTPTLHMNRTQHTLPAHRALRPMALLRARV